MAISHLSNAESPDAQVPLVHSTVDGVIDYKGNSALRANSGSWRSAAFLIGVKVAERFAYFGISCNIRTYLMGSLGQSTATAAD
ncbi:protein NRT1/ PTR FAMILY 5.15-like [Alnus glutinosa]|uniref:protein NRT1/ PTR FAMILY 5.15-like n=1 Tax=Alnus glutinosa TaxID=3517 RepID=UPI002D76FF71|nr:protein NRT1/ PTR FAMILY 5.15-like [Alnus glutinosa]